MKKFSLVFFSLALFTALFMWSCSYPSSKRTVVAFERYQSRFQTIAEYMETVVRETTPANTDGENACWIKFRSADGEMDVSWPKGSSRMAIPKAGDDVKDAVRFLLTRLRYGSICRTSISGQTIIFEMRPPNVNWRYYNEGICYVVDGGAPTPEYNYDYYTETLTPLGDNWYYWNGHCYFG